VRLTTPSLLSLLLCSLVGLHSSQVVYAQEVAEESPKEPVDQATSELTPPADEDDLWAIPPSATGEEVIDFNQRKVPPRFEWGRLEQERSSQHVFVEHHGYFRFRADLFYNLDLDTYSTVDQRGTSQVLPPLTDRASGAINEESDSLSSANIRFRYEPIIHIGEQLRIHSVLDLPSNLILGSTPDGGPMNLYRRTDVQLDSLSDTQRPLSDAFQLKHVWGVWESELVRFDFGRLRHHWGLGIMANGGACLDCDFGDSVDRFQASTQIFNTYVSLSWDMVSEGPTGFGVSPQLMGQPWDWDQRDDVDQYSFSLYQIATSEEELAQKRAALKAGSSVFEWGFYGIFRQQQNAAAFLNLGDAQEPPTTPTPEQGGWTLYPTDLNLFIPDLFLSWTYHPKASHEYRLRVEATGLLGEIETIPLASFITQDAVACENPRLDVADCPLSQQFSPRTRDIMSWGYALEFDVKIKNLLWGLHHGGASGDENSGFFGEGALDRPEEQDEALNGFRFDRDYIVDMILFRQVLGGVHNALYFKPYVGYEVLKKLNTFWGFKASILYARALESQWTAGNDANLGVELNAEAYIYEKSRFRASAAYGFLFPLAGMDLLNVQRSKILKSAGGAQTFQLNFGLMF
jgi:uncharacterized protein (TIGR04551 family)